MKITLPLSVVASGQEEFAKGPGSRVGRSNSLKWPWLYDKLRAKGYDKSKAAAISNSRLKFRKKGRLSVLDAKTAHNPATLRKLAKADKAGKHSTKGTLRASAHVATLAFACHDASCAPPPAGTGGSRPGGKSRGKLSNIGMVESTKYPGSYHRIDEHGVVSNGFGGKAQVEQWVKRRRALVKGMMTRDAANTKSAPQAQEFKTITADQARGDSRPVSHEEFQRLARRGQQQLDKFAADSSPIEGLDRNWNAVKDEAYVEVRKSWGGATFDAHTGDPLPQGANKYAITVKSGQQTVSVPDNATEQEFKAAMDVARERFRPLLERSEHHLGVFHDDDNGRIDIDPVLVVSKSSDVETIGAATHAIGGAYNFRDGLGYWPPHVDTSPTATRKRDDYERTYES